MIPETSRFAVTHETELKKLEVVTMNENIISLLAKDPTTLSNEELLELISYTNSLRSTTAKQAKDRKLEVPKKVKSATVATPELALLSDAFKVIIDNNLDIIKALFPASSEKPAGQKGVNVAIKDAPFYIQILNKAAFELDRENAKKAKEAEKAEAAAGPSAEQIAANEAAKTGTLLGDAITSLQNDLTGTL